MTDKTITIRLDSETYKQIKMEVARQGTTLKSYILKLIEADLNSKKEIK